MLYLGERSEALLPKEPGARARATQWLIAALNSIEPFVMNVALFPLELVRCVSRERLGIVPEELDSGHLPALACPDALVDLFERLRSDHACRGL